MMRYFALMATVIFLLFACSEVRTADTPVTIVSPLNASTNGLPMILTGTLAYTPQIRAYFSTEPTADFSITNIHITLIYKGSNDSGKSVTLTNQAIATGSGGGFTLVIDTNGVLSNVILPTRVYFEFSAPVYGEITKFYFGGSLDEYFVVAQ